MQNAMTAWRSAAGLAMAAWRAAQIAATAALDISAVYKSGDLCEVPDDHLSGVWQVAVVEKGLTTDKTGRRASSMTHNMYPTRKTPWQLNLVKTGKKVSSMTHKMRPTRMSVGQLRSLGIRELQFPCEVKLTSDSIWRCNKCLSNEFQVHIHSECTASLYTYLTRFVVYTLCLLFINSLCVPPTTPQ